MSAKNKGLRENTVLFVDDEDKVLKSIERGLKDEKYKKIFAKTAEESMKAIKEDNVHVIVTDLMIPGVTGLELLKTVMEKHPHIIRIIMSSHMQPQIVLATINQLNVFKFIPKPWNLDDELIPAIREALNRYNSKYNDEILDTSLLKKELLYQKLLKKKEENIIYLKKGVNFLNQLQHDFNRYIDDLAESVNQGELEYELFLEEMLFIENLMDQYMKTFPISHSTININDLEDDLNRIITRCVSKHLKGISFESDSNRVNFILQRAPEFELEGNNKLLLLCFKIIFETLFQGFYHNVFSIIVNDKSLPNMKQNRLIFLITEEFSWFTDSELRLNSALVFLENWVSHFNGRINIVKKDDKKMVLLEIYLDRLTRTLADRDLGEKGGKRC